MATDEGGDDEKSRYKHWPRFRIIKEFPTIIIHGEVFNNFPEKKTILSSS